MIKIAGVEQMAVGRERDVADEIRAGPVGSFDDFKGARGAQRSIRVEGKLEDSGLAAAADPKRAAVLGKGHAEPGVPHPRAADLTAVLGIEHAERRRIVAAIQDNQEPAVRRENAGHGQRVERNLRSRGLHAPSAVEQESAVGQRADLLALGGLRGQKGRDSDKDERGEEDT